MLTILFFLIQPARVLRRVLHCYICVHPVVVIEHTDIKSNNLPAHRVFRSYARDRKHLLGSFLPNNKFIQISH